MRNLLRLAPAIRELAASVAMRSVVEPVLGAEAFPVRGLLFDKTPGANWKVAWHQDLSIAVAKKIDTPGFGPWSIKADVPHVQPLASVLQNMLTVRLHLDDCDENNGPLNVLPGSHAQGVLSVESVMKMREAIEPFSCQLRAGGALLMRPLLLHASSAATSPNHRRVVHIEFANQALPNGLKWFEA
jgi:ectoine hydroxylase-related dioxygenase (phytanoyl-CoA dioxygenase family)